MNIKISNRLIELRKKYGYSQEQLAEKLGLSRQAVSKWERAEASPDTDNLICLAKLYNVSLDELLSTDEEDIETIIKDNKEKNNDDEKKQGIYIKEGEDSLTIENGKIHIIGSDGDSVHIANGIHIEGSDGDSVHITDGRIELNSSDGQNLTINYKKWIYNTIKSIIFILGIITYVVLGFVLNNGWALYWPVILIALSLASIISVIEEKKFCNFLFPVLIAGIYCLIGMIFSFWHPLWVIFLFIPVYYAVFEPIDKHLKHRKLNASSSN